MWLVCYIYLEVEVSIKKDTMYLSFLKRECDCILNVFHYSFQCDSASRSNFPAFLTVQRYNRSPFHEGFWPFVTYLYVYRGLQQVFIIKEHFWFLQFKTRKISQWLFCPCRKFYFRMNLWIKFETCRIEFKLIFFLHKRSNHLTPSSKLKLRLEN